MVRRKEVGFRRLLVVIWLESMLGGWLYRQWKWGEGVVRHGEDIVGEERDERLGRRNGG